MDEENVNPNFGKTGCCIACLENGKCSHPCFCCVCTKCQWYTDGPLFDVYDK